MSKATREQRIDTESKSVFNSIVIKSDEYKSMIKDFTTDEEGKTVSKNKSEMQTAFDDFLVNEVMEVSVETIKVYNGKDKEVDKHLFELTNCSTPDFHNGTVEELLVIAENLATLKVDAQAILDNSLKQDITDSNLLIADTDKIDA